MISKSKMKLVKIKNKILKFGLKSVIKIVKTIIEELKKYYRFFKDSRPPIEENTVFFYSLLCLWWKKYR